MTMRSAVRETAGMAKRLAIEYQQGDFLMRIAHALAVAGFLAASPAMAQLSITNGNDAAAAHDHDAQQDRTAAHQNVPASHQEAAMGNHGAAAQDRTAAHQNVPASHQEAAMGNHDAAAQDRTAAHEDRLAAHGQDHATDRDANSGVTVRLGQ